MAHWMMQSYTCIDQHLAICPTNMTNNFRVQKTKYHRETSTAPYQMHVLQDFIDRFSREIFQFSSRHPRYTSKYTQEIQRQAVFLDMDLTLTHGTSAKSSTYANINNFYCIRLLLKIEKMRNDGSHTEQSTDIICIARVLGIRKEQNQFTKYSQLY